MTCTVINTPRNIATYEAASGAAESMGPIDLAPLVADCKRVCSNARSGSGHASNAVVHPPLPSFSLKIRDCQFVGSVPASEVDLPGASAGWDSFSSGLTSNLHLLSPRPASWHALPSAWWQDETLHRAGFASADINQSCGAKPRAYSASETCCARRSGSDPMDAGMERCVRRARTITVAPRSLAQTAKVMG